MTTQRGICSACGRPYAVVIRHHWRPENQRERFDWDCPGTGRPPASVLPDPLAAARAEGWAAAVAALRDDSRYRAWAQSVRTTTGYWPLGWENAADYLEALAAAPQTTGGTDGS